jgi:WD40 repeat protein
MQSLQVPILPTRAGAARVYGYDVFVSFALGPAPRGTVSYASDLTRQLRERDLTVYFSEVELAPGGGLDESLRRSLDRSRMLVVVANHEALLDPRWIRAEVEEFRQRNPSRPVIAVSVDGALDDEAVSREAQPWLQHAGRKWIDESASAVRDGLASPRVVDALVLARNWVSSGVKWRRLVGGTVATLVVMLVGVVVLLVYVVDRNDQLSQAFVKSTAQRLHAEGSAMIAGSRAGGFVRGLRQVLAAHQLSASPDVEGFMAAQVLALERVSSIVDTEGSSAIDAEGRRWISVGVVDNSLQVWDAASGVPLGRPMLGHENEIQTVVFSPDGRFIASGGLDNTVRLWDAASYQPIGEPLRGHTDKVNGLAFTPDGRGLISTGDDSAILRWDVQRRQLLAPAIRHEGSIWRPVVDGTGTRLATVGSRGDVRVWKLPTGEPLAAIGVSASVVALSPNGKQLAAADHDGRLHVLDIETGKPVRPPWEARGVSSISFSPDGRLIASGSVRTVRLWRLDSEGPVAVLEGHLSDVNRVTFSADGRQVLSSDGETLVTWNVAPPVTAAARGGFGEGVMSVAFGADERLLVTGNLDGTFQRWDAITGSPLGEPVRAHSGDVTSIAFLSDGRRFITGGGRSIGIWDSTSGEALAGGWSEPADVTALALSANNEFVAVGRYDGTVRLHSLVSNQDVAILRGHDEKIVSLSFSPDGKMLVGGGMGGTISRWDAHTGRRLEPAMKQHRLAVSFLEFSPDGATLISAADLEPLVRWDVRNGSLSGAPLRGREWSFRALAFSPDGRYILTGHADGSVRPWDVSSGEPMGAPMRRHQFGTSVNAVAFSRDARRMASGGSDRMVWLWHGPAVWVEQLCAKLRGSIGAGHWREMVSPEIPYRPPCKERSTSAVVGAVSDRGVASSARTTRP